MRMKLDTDELTRQNDKVYTMKIRHSFISQCTVKYVCAKNGVFPSKSFHGDDAKRKLDERPSSKKNDPDGPAEKTNKRVQSREPSQSRVTKIAASLLFTKNVKALVQRLDAKHMPERLLQRYPKTSN